MYLQTYKFYSAEELIITLLNAQVEIFRLEKSENILFPVLSSKVKAGGYGSFESAALDFPDDTIDLYILR